MKNVHKFFFLKHNTYTQSICKRERNTRWLHIDNAQTPSFTKNKIINTIYNKQQTIY